MWSLLLRHYGYLLRVGFPQFFTITKKKILQDFPYIGYSTDPVLKLSRLSANIP